MATENRTKIKSTARDIRYFIFGLFILYLLGCCILYLTLSFFQEWGLVGRGVNGIYFTLDDSSIELIDFYNVFSAPRLAYTGSLKAHPIITLFSSLLLFLVFIRVTSYFNKEKEIEVIGDKGVGQGQVKLKPDFVDFVIMGLKGSTKEEAFIEISKFAEKKGLVKNQRYLYERLMEKERMGSSAIGNGIALPEACFIDTAQGDAFILCRAQEELDFDALDGKPVSILFVFLCREKNDLSKSSPILRLMNTLKLEKYRSKFMEANTEYEMYQLLEEMAQD
jgi:mannitol/fructose-specific phosphotransferase system IIA component (Ntr-type)